MYSKIYERLIRSWGYHGTHVTIYSDSWDTTFWKDEYQINFSIRCRNKELSYEDMRCVFLKVLMFAETERIKNISKEDNIEELLKKYLIEQASFESVQTTESRNPYFSAYRDGTEYRIHVSMYTEENYALDKYEEDHDAVMESSKEDLIRLLSEKGLRNFEVDVSPDFLSIGVTLHNNQKIHHLNIHAHYNDWLYMWSIDASQIIACYWEIIGSHYLNIDDLIENLQEYYFYEISTTKNGIDSLVLYAYKDGYKYSVNIDVENEVIPFDNMEGHAFEQFCAAVLAKNGFEDIRVTQGSGDQGVDIIAYKDYVKYGIQCKCYSSDIGNRAVQEVFAGKTYYQCHVGVVLTNRYFTKSAKELAQRNGVILWDRDRLLEMVEKYYEKGK